MNAKIPTKRLGLYMLFCFAIFALALHADPREQIVTLDTKHIINQVIEYNQSNLEKSNVIESASACLSALIEDYAKQHQVLILPSQAAIAGNKDITQTIKAQMQRRCLQND